MGNTETYSYLKEYILHESLFENEGVKTAMKFPHHFYTPHSMYMEKAFGAFDPFPLELKCFYEEIGYGFFHKLANSLSEFIRTYHKDKDWLEYVLDQ